MAEWLRRVIRNHLEEIPREFESLCCRNFFFVALAFTRRCAWLDIRGTRWHGARGAMDSASDFESGGCGFESRRACFYQLTRLSAVSIAVFFFASDGNGRGFNCRASSFLFFFFFSVGSERWSVCAESAPHKTKQSTTGGPFIFPVTQTAEPLTRSSAKIGTIQRRLAWPLRKDDTHKSRMYHFLL